MSLNFNVLWFENQPGDIPNTIEEIREYIEESGFRAGIDIQTDTSHLEALSQRQEEFNDFDLVLVDWDLGLPAVQGDEVARRVRSRFGFTDIIFYSGKAPANLREMVHKLQIDGVYCMPRTQLVPSLRDHIDEVVKRISRLEAMRGVAMGVAGVCDEQFKAILLSIYRAAEDEKKAELADRLDRLVVDGQGNSAKKYRECPDFTAKLTSRAVTSFHLQKLVLELTKGNDAVRPYRSILGHYNAEVLDPRNILGHAVEQRGANGWEILSGSEKSIKREDFPILRVNFLRHLDNVASLRRYFDEGPQKAA